MICPGCGVNIDLYLKQQTEREMRVKKEEEFERIFGEQLRPIKRKRALMGMTLGVLIGLLADVFISCINSWVFNISFGETLRQLRNDYLAAFFIVFTLLVPVASCMLGGFAHGKDMPGKKETELRKSFSLLP